MSSPRIVQQQAASRLASATRREAQGRGFMARPYPTRWLSDQARLGLRELPTNAAWLLSRAVRPADAAGSAAAGTRDKARKLRASLPVGDSVETRMKRARAAAERAQEAEDDALEAAQWSKESSDHVREVADSNRAWLAEVKREASRRAEQRVAEARREADEQVEQERAAARSEADEELETAQAEATEQIEAAKRDAEAVQQRAKDLLAE